MNTFQLGIILVDCEFAATAERADRPRVSAGRPCLPGRPLSRWPPTLSAGRPLSRRSWSCGWHEPLRNGHKGNHNSKIAGVSTAGRLEPGGSGQGVEEDLGSEAQGHCHGGPGHSAVATGRRPAASAAQVGHRGADRAAYGTAATRT